MKFKKGDTIVKNNIISYSSAHQWSPKYEITNIANGDLFSDQYYVLGSGVAAAMYDSSVVDEQFQLSLKDILKNL